MSIHVYNIPGVVFLKNAKARLKVLESELKSLQWEHEVLEQRFSQVILLYITAWQHE